MKTLLIEVQHTLSELGRGLAKTLVSRGQTKYFVVFFEEDNSIYRDSELLERSLNHYQRSYGHLSSYLPGRSIELHDGFKFRCTCVSYCMFVD